MPFPMMTINISDKRTCTNLNSHSFTLQCDLGKDIILLRLIGKNYRDNKADISIRQTTELLALRESVFKGKCNPAIFADMLEEYKDTWVSSTYPQEILDKLRACWSETIRLSKEVVEPEVEYIEEVTSES